MPRRASLLLSGIVIALGVAACGDDGMERLTIEDSETSIEISTGETFEVVLEGNPTTGFSWVVESGDSGIVEVTGEPAFEPESDLVGAGGEYTFVFEGKSAGTTTLELAYRRTFEAAPPERTFSVTVTVE